METLLIALALGLSLTGWSGSWADARAYQGNVPEILITDNNERLNLDCSGAEVTVQGNHNTISLSGTCSSLAVQGNKNTITLEAPTDVTDTGNSNTITVVERSAATATSAPTATPAPPTHTPVPTHTPQTPTDTPQAPTNTPQSPTATPQGQPTNTPQAPTPQSPTDTPQAPTETPTLDTEAPTVRWIAPVPAGERYDIQEGEQVILEADAEDNAGVSVVRFLWWDAVNELYIPLATFAQPPYRQQISASTLNMEWNQVFVVASDEAQNSSDYSSIWIYKLVLPGSQSEYQIFLPITGR